MEEVIPRRSFVDGPFVLGAPSMIHHGVGLPHASDPATLVVPVPVLSVRLEGARKCGDISRSSWHLLPR